MYSFIYLSIFLFIYSFIYLKNYYEASAKRKRIQVIQNKPETDGFG